MQHLSPTETFAGSLLCAVDHQLTGPWAQVQMGKGAEQQGGGCGHGRVLGAELRTQTHACPRAWQCPEKYKLPIHTERLKLLAWSELYGNLEERKMTMADGDLLRGTSSKTVLCEF